MTYSTSEECRPEGFEDAPTASRVKGVVVKFGQDLLAGLVFVDADKQCVCKYGPLDRENLDLLIEYLQGLRRELEGEALAQKKTTEAK